MIAESQRIINKKMFSQSSVGLGTIESKTIERLIAEVYSNLIGGDKD